MSTTQAVMTPALLWRALFWVVRGGLAMPRGHLPPPDHAVPADFCGVGVAAADDPAVDDVLLGWLQVLGLRNVRLDFSYGDLEGPAARLLERLLDAKHAVLLHLVQPFDNARAMPDAEACATWADFVESVLTRFGPRIQALEVGSTINRRRWAGYGSTGFFSAWAIAHAAARRHGVVLAGPGVTDFEPLYNVAVLGRLRAVGQLPDWHTDNLFSERVTEPERFDHRVLGLRWSTRLRYNLIKKARLLQRIGHRYGIATLVSPCAFWTLPRIARLLPDTEQKQADYLTRYFVLCAASGALRQAYWGPLVCHREGLVDDGSANYPALERVTHYRSITGRPQDFRPRPSFHALRTFNRLIAGARYLGAPHTAAGLELHIFRQPERLLHVVWTLNGRALPLRALYGMADLAEAACFDRDGNALPVMPDFASESPLYLAWPADATIAVTPTPERDAWIALHRHQPDRQAYLFAQDGWRGAFHARSMDEAAMLRKALHPDTLPRPTSETLLRKARNAIWILEIPGLGKVVAKQPLKLHPHKRLLDRHKLSKARRSWDAAAELLRRGIPTARPIAYFEQPGDASRTRNLYLCEFVSADCTARELVSALAAGADAFSGITAQDAYDQLCDFLLRMHGRGVYFRDLSGGNILIRKQENGRLDFCLIDINRARFFNHPTPLDMRLADLARICNKLHWAGREALVGQYLRALGVPFDWRRRLPFHLYDFKVWLKRRLGRKAIKRLFFA